MKELIEHGKGHLSSWLIFLIIVVIIPACLKNQSQEKYRVWQAQVSYTKPA